MLLPLINVKRSRKIALVANCIINQNSKMEIDLSDIESGVYFIRINGQNFNKIEKIVIQ